MDDPDGIFRWQRIDARLTSSGQPSEAQLAEIAAFVGDDAIGSEHRYRGHDY